VSIQKPFSLVKRVARWYLAPSGLLLAVALVLLAIGFAVTDAGRWFGLAGVAVLALFLPYRFARQQGWADRRVHAASMVAKTANFESNGKIDEVSGEVATLDGRVALMRTSFEENNDVVAVLRSAVSTLDEQVTSVDRRSAEAGEIARTAAQAASATRNLHGDVAALRSRLVDRISQLEAERDTVRALSAQVQQIEATRADTTKIDQELAQLRADLDETVRTSDKQSETNRRAAEALGLVTRVERLEAELQAERSETSAIAAAPVVAKVPAPADAGRLDEIAALQAELETALEGLLRRERLSGAMTGSGFHHISRSLSEEDVAELAEWASRLGITTSERAISYLAHEIRRTEDMLVGRMAGSLGSAALRTLVLRAVKRKQLHVVEIGSLFGVSIAAMEATTFGFFKKRRFTAVDPLDGYYQSQRFDVLTGLPVSREIFDENMRRVGLDEDRLTVLQHLSTDKVALESIKSGSADVLFIDGDHSRFGVEFDYRRYKHVVASGGFIILDDYQTKAWPDVTEFVDTVLMADDSLHCVGKGWETAVFRVL